MIKTYIKIDETKGETGDVEKGSNKSLLQNQS